MAVCVRVRAFSARACVYTTAFFLSGFYVITCCYFLSGFSAPRLALSLDMRKPWRLIKVFIAFLTSHARFFPYISAMRFQSSAGSFIVMLVSVSMVYISFPKYLFVTSLLSAVMSKSVQSFSISSK